MADITQLLNVIGGAAGTTSGLQDKLRTATGSAKEAITEGTTAVQQQIANQGIIDVQAAKGALEAQTNARAAATSLGTNMSDASQIVTMVGDSMKQSAVQVITRSKAVNEIEGRADLFSNPAGFMYDLLYGDAARGALAGAATQFDASTKVMQNLNTATQQSVATQNAIAETHTTATVAAQEELVANNAAVAAAKAKSALAGADMQFINIMDGLNARQVQLANSAYSVQAQSEQQAWMRADREAAKAAKAADKKGDDTILSYYNAGAKLMNAPMVDSMAGLRAMSTVNKNKTDYLLSRGAEILTAGDARVASNPFEALSVVREFNVPLNPAQTQVAKKFNSELGSALQVGNIERVLAAQGADPKTLGRTAREMAGDKKQWASLQTEWLKFKAVDDAEVVKVGDAGNIYAPPSLSFLNGKSEMDTNPFLAKYIKPVAAAEGGPVFDPSQFMAFAAKASAEDRISVSDITDGIVWMANQAKASNNATINYQRTFGIANQEKLVMPTVIEGGNLFTNSVLNIDLTNPTAVTSRVLDAIAAQKKQGAISLSAGIGNMFGGSSNP